MNGLQRALGPSGCEWEPGGCEWEPGGCEWEPGGFRAWNCNPVGFRVVSETDGSPWYWRCCGVLRARTSGLNLI
ncbi:hypothetical protein GCM10008961_20390 [Deinococcus knuensis]|uniref:Uncharacterized protein n=1 Tax=Deinococcus knuensis TaxID=1837380 RepID=A0ABQ2SGS5_9DEIO|nr:hypothetical protein GCM10008961_20390 [Deinococcus knuensis]